MTDHMAEDQVLLTRFRVLDTVRLGPEPVGARDRLRTASRVSLRARIGRLMAMAAAAGVVALIGVALGRGLDEARTQIASPGQPTAVERLRPLDLPTDLGPVRLQLAPDGGFVALISADFRRVQLLEIRSDTPQLTVRSELEGNIVDSRWREDAGGLLVQVAKTDRVRDQVVDLYLLRPTDSPRLIVADIPKGAAMAARPGADAVAVLFECCPSAVRVFAAGSTTTAFSGPGVVTLLGWNARGELLYAVNGEIHFWTERGSEVLVLPERPESVGLLSWSPDRASVVIGAGRTGALQYYLLSDRQSSPITFGTPTGLWLGSREALIRSGQDLLAFAGATPRPVATMTEVPGVLWGVVNGTLLWSDRGSSELRFLDLEGGESAPPVSERTRVVLVAADRFLLLPEGGRPLLGELR